jgi:hypothetical protein
MWLFVLVAAGALVPAIEGARGRIPRSLGLLSGVAAVAGLFLAGAFGLKGHRIARDEREKAAARAALVMLAAALKDRADPELEALARQAGSAGEAARMVLARRREDRARASRPAQRPGPA